MSATLVAHDRNQKAPEASAWHSSIVLRCHVHVAVHQVDKGSMAAWSYPNWREGRRLDVHFSMLGSVMSKRGLMTPHCKT